MPIELKLANPHSANVAMVKDRGSRVACHRAEPLEGDEFVRHHAQAEQVADAGNRARESRSPTRPAQKIQPKICSTLEGNHAMPMHGETAVHAAEDAIHQVDQRDERDQHGADVEREMQAVDGAARDGAEDIGVALDVAPFRTRPAVSGFSVSGTSIFAIRIVPGAVMITAVEQMLGFDADRRCTPP